MNQLTEPSLRQAPPTSTQAPTRLNLLVRQIRYEAKGINSYELVDPDGAELPAASAGSHLDIYLDGGVVRQYSIASDPADRHRYVIAVLRDETGRGGSKAMHASVRVQDIVSVSMPRNNFPVAADAGKHLMIAGGIGVTPLKAMAHHFERTGCDYEFHYCCKGRDFAAFGDQLAPLVASGRLVMHFDGGRPSDGLDIPRLLENPSPGTHVYYCGPSGFMSACAKAAAHWPSHTVHFEHFKAPEIPARSGAERAFSPAGEAADPGVDPGTFMVQIASTCAVLPVPESKTIVDVLRGAGIEIETSCESGLCGTCKVRFLSGDVDHRDFILSDAEHLDQMTACVSRCKGGTLVLDL